MSIPADLRVDIGDDVPSPRYTESQLVEVLQKAARRVNRSLSITGTSDELAVDASGNVTPDNQDLQDILLLQAECMIMQIDANYDYFGTGGNAGGGYAVRDGEQSLDTRDGARASARANYMNTPYNPCAELAKEILDEKLRRANEAAKDIW